MSHLVGVSVFFFSLSDAIAALPAARNEREACVDAKRVEQRENNPQHDEKQQLKMKKSRVGHILAFFFNLFS